MTILLKELRIVCANGEFEQDVRKAFFQESDGVAERQNKALLNATKTMLLQIGAQRKHLWAESVYSSYFYQNLSAKSQKLRAKLVITSCQA